MNQPDKIKRYISNVNELFSKVNDWLSDTALKATSESIQIHEEGFDIYTALLLKIDDSDGKEIAELRPIGALVLGADGRVDLIGKFDKTELIILEDILTAEPQTVHSLYKGVDVPGWYWLEDKRRSKAHQLSQELFSELLTEVSDYGL